MTKTKIGKATIEYKQAKSILTAVSGFANAFDYSLNPYSGCTFGCVYCYAAFFARTEDLKNTWGRWVQVKENALELLKKWRKKPLIDKLLYMSTVTDPYQPVEGELELTRAVLQELLEHHQARLVVQTRGTLVARDIDLLKQFKYAQVNMTVTTDDEEVRKMFEPTCTSIRQRLDTIRQITEAGIQTCISMTPLLPVRDPQAFAKSLLETGVKKFIVQDFHAGQTRFVASTGDAARKLAQEMNWTRQRYEEVRAILEATLPNLWEGKDGFTPEWENI